ncbi:MAG: sce7725 family protein [Gemmatimonadota bacterium]|nr:sce7725 family protein [Gemmatimonadota bacterium]
MYFPYLRGKQEEVLAVLQAPFLSRLTVPVFEPTSTSDRTLNRWNRLVDLDRRFALITNSVNVAADSSDSVSGFIDGSSPDMVLPALEVRANTMSNTIWTFVEEYCDRRCLIVHRNHVYSVDELATYFEPIADEAIQVFSGPSAAHSLSRELPGRGRVALQDGFPHQTRNADFPPRTQFGDLLQTFGSRGFQGFGDFTIVGDRFLKGGGPANAVALHLTEIAGGTVVTNHFKSDEPHISGDTPGKYSQALERLVEHTQDKSQFNTVGVHAFVDSWTRNHFPNLGPPKRWSILHHFEIMEREMSRMGLTPFF